MSLVSSPLAYPASSSPRRDDSPRKRRKLDVGAPREPLHDISNHTRFEKPPATLAGFLVDDDSDDDSGAPTEQDKPLASAQHPEALSVDPRVASEDDFHNIDKVPQSVLAPDESLDPSAPLKLISARTCSGLTLDITQRRRTKDVFYGDLVAAKSKVETNRAQKDFYGIDIHRLMDQGNAAIEAAKNAPRTTLEPTALPTTEPTAGSTANSKKSQRLHLWTEKYRARKFTDLLGDERTHRSVLRWFKSWDSVVFPHAAKPKVKSEKLKDALNEERQHRKILLLTGPPGLGKTTLAHICARQAGYETQEINASDERSKDVVNGRIRDMVGTENVRSVDSKSARRAARPLCVVVDEVDGVVSGSSHGGGEGGFIKALIDLVALDQRNSSKSVTSNAGSAPARKKKKGENFRLLRPLVLICNDVYHPSLRPIRQSPVAEVIHVRRPPINMVIPRLSSIFEKEGIRSDNDAVRTLCEAAWGVTSKRKGGSGSVGGGGVTEGDIRSILVIGEWVACQLRVATLDSAQDEADRLTRHWVEKHVVGELAHGGGAARSLGRGGTRECVQRVFAHNAGFPSSSGVKKSSVTEDLLGAGGATEAAKKATMDRLREMIETSGDEDRIMTDCFSAWPTAPFQDTTTLTKPCAAHDWLHFSGMVSRRVHTAQEWDLMPYMAFPALAFHSLFAATSASARPDALAEPNKNDDSADASAKADPFAGPRPDAAAAELHKQSTATLTELHSSLSIPLRRLFNTPASLATDLLPYTLRLLNPSANPTLLGGQASLRRAPEKARIARAASAMSALGVRFDKARVDAAGDAAALADARAAGNAGWVLRMAPPLDEAGAFATLDDAAAGRPGGDAGRARFALRLVLEQALQAESARRDGEARVRRGGGGVLGATDEDAGPREAGAQAQQQRAAAPKAGGGVKRDFFGRPVVAATAAGDGVAAGADSVAARSARASRDKDKDKARGRSAVWVTYHEGFSNAVRKPISMRELLEGL